MLENKAEPLIYLRYGLSRKKELLRDIKALYDGIVVPANILLYQYKGTPAIIYSSKQPFVVDPMSYLFAHPLDDFKKRIEAGSTKFKPSFAKLVQGYGQDPDYLLTQDYQTLVDYLSRNESKLTPFIENAIGFQWNVINDTINKSKDLLPDGQEVNLRPSFVIPPYFAYHPGDGTTALNRKIINFVRDNRAKWPEADIFPMLFLERKNLNSNFAKTLRQYFSQDDFPGYCIWIDSFDERDVKKDEVKSLIELVKLFATGGKQIVVLFGGFFSALLSKFGVTCVSHGIAYSESKSMFAAVKQTSGAAPVRYYVPSLHQFLTTENALTVLRERADLICDCPVCKRIVQSNPENVTRFEDEEELAELHFLYNRNREKKMIAGFDLAQAIKYLEYIETVSLDIEKITKHYKMGDGYQVRSIVKPEYIREWKAAFEESI